MMVLGKNKRDTASVNASKGQKLSPNVDILNGIRMIEQF